jgi:hypothetical protein
MGIRDMRTWSNLARDDGITVLLSSHLLAEVERVCSPPPSSPAASAAGGEVASLLAGRGSACAPPGQAARRIAPSSAPGPDRARPAARRPRRTPAR